MLVKLVKVYPVDMDVILNACEGAKLVYLLEEGIKDGGIAEKISSSLCGKFDGRIIINAVDNECAFHATTQELIEHFGMMGQQIAEEVRECLS